MSVYYYSGLGVRPPCTDSLKAGLVQAGVPENDIVEITHIDESFLTKPEIEGTLVIPGGHFLYLRDALEASSQKIYDLINSGKLNLFGSCSGGLYASDVVRLAGVKAKFPPLGSHHFSGNFAKPLYPTYEFSSDFLVSALDKHTRVAGTSGEEGTPSIRGCTSPQLLKISACAPAYKKNYGLAAPSTLDDEDDSKIRFENTQRVFTTHWNRGPYFDIDPNADIKVIARYIDADPMPPQAPWPDQVQPYFNRVTNPDEDLPVACAGNCGEGQIAAVGVHPELALSTDDENSELNLELIQKLCRLANIRLRNLD